MLLIWKGLGFLVPVIVGGVLIMTVAVGSAVLGEGGMERHALTVMGVGLLLAALALFKLGQRLHRDSDRTVMDVATGQTVVLRRRHTFWFIKMEGWGALLAAAGALAVVLSLVAGDSLAASGPRVGGLYSTENGERFAVVKVLAVEGEAVHVRLYAEDFAERPSQVDAANLTIGDPDSLDGGVAYLAIEDDAFDVTDPKLLSVEPVTAEELAGRKAWETLWGGHVFSEEELTYTGDE